MTDSSNLARVYISFVLCLHTGLLGWSAVRHSPVVAEVAHLPAGLSHIELGRFDLYRVNPPLVRTVAALPVFFSNPAVDWSRHDGDPLRRSELDVGRDFLAVNGSNSQWLFTIARWACIPFSLLGAIVCFQWARAINGTAGGLVAITLWCFSPNILGNAALISCDTAAAALGLTTAFAFWRWLKKPTWRRCAVAGIWWGVAELSKTTLLLFYPILPIIWVVDRWASRRSNRAVICQRWADEALMLLVMVAVSVWVINAAYNYQGSLRRLGDYQFQSAALAGVANVDHDSQRWGNRFVDRWPEAIPIPLPSDYVQGIDRQRSDFERSMRSYLAGEWQSGGWWYFYLYALAVKVPLGTWGLLMMAIGATALRQGYVQSWRDEIMLLAPAIGILLLVSSQTGLSLHPRYVLPMAPFMFVWISKLGRSFVRRDWPIVAPAAIALCWSAASSLWIYPHSLSYFNELAGGPRQGHEHLVNSGLGWGQDLLFLEDWLEQHPEAKPLRLASFGQVDPRLVGNDFLLPPIRPLESDAEVVDWGPPPAWYAIDVNHLRGCGETTPDGRGGWHVPGTWGGEFSYFQTLKPVATAGYSIWIYHVRPPQSERVQTQFSVDSRKQAEKTGPVE